MKPGSRRIEPLALILLAAFLALPFVVYFVPTHWWRGEFAYQPPRRIVEWVTGGEKNSAGPTEGMIIGAQGFGTVTEAPALLARKSAESRPSGYLPGNPIAPDVARFIRAIPRERPLNPRKDGMRVCTLEGPPHYSGKIVLVDGCLRFHDEDSTEPGPLLLGIDSVHRDSENYLAVGLRDAAPEYEIRVGEPGGIFVGLGCSMDDPVPAPPELTRACGIAQMRRLGTIKRKRLCTEEELQELARLRAEFTATEARLRAEHEKCAARGGAERACPPPVAPPPVELWRAQCRTPMSSPTTG